MRYRPTQILAGGFVGRALVIAGSLWVGGLIAGYYLGFGDTARYHLETAWMWLLGGLCTYALVTHRAPPAVVSSAHGLAIVPVSLGTLALAMVLFAPSLSIGLLSDDFVLAARVSDGSYWSVGGTEFFRPGPHLLWYLVFETVGRAPIYLHAINVVIHAANAILVAVIAARLGLRAPLAVGAGWLFLCIPSAVEPVAWASGIQDVLMTFGCLIFAVCVSNRTSPFVQLTAVAGLVIGLLTKETAVVAPALAALLWWGRPGSRNALPGWPLLLTGAGLSTAYGLWRLIVTAVPPDYAVVPSRYFLKEFLVRPFAALAVPWSESVLEQAVWLGPVSATCVLAVLTVTALRQRARAELFTLIRLGVWVVVSVMPVYAYLSIADDMEGARYVYLGAVGWCLLLVVGVSVSFDATRAGRAAAAIVLGSTIIWWSWGTRVHQAPWRQAAELRDRVLVAATDVLSQTTCRSATFDDLPDSVEGAFVFRNGFEEALAERMDVDVPARQPAADRCRFGWTGTAFVAVE